MIENMLEGDVLYISNIFIQVHSFDSLTTEFTKKWIHF